MKFIFWGLAAQMSLVSLLLADVCPEPILHRNQIPMAAIFLELTPSTTCTLPSGVIYFNSTTQKSNTTLIAPSNDTSVPRYVIDHERIEQTLSYKYGITSQSDVGLKLRYIKDSAGNWDSFLRQYHKITGLPYAARKVRQDNQFLYWQYNPETEKWFYVDTPQKGWGDAVFNFRSMLATSQGWNNPIQWSWRAEYKHPSSENLPSISSGSSDFGLGMMASTKESLFGNTTNLWSNFGAVFAGTTKHKVYEQEPVIFSGALGSIWSFSNQFSMNIQVLSASPRYQVSERVRGLNHRQSILALDVGYFYNRHHLSFGFTEDLDYNSSEDFSFIFSWKIDTK